MVLQTTACHSHLSTILVTGLYLTSFDILLLSSENDSAHHAALQCPSLTIVDGEILHRPVRRRTVGIVEIGKDSDVANIFVMHFGYHSGQLSAKIL